MQCSLHSLDPPEDPSECVDCPLAQARTAGQIRAMELRTKARRLQAESGLDLILVDYLQLMRGSHRSERLSASYASRNPTGVRHGP